MLGGSGTPPSSIALVLGGAGKWQLCTALQTAGAIFFAGLRRPVVGKVLHMKWLEGELHGFHHVAARHCGDASRRT